MKKIIFFDFDGVIADSFDGAFAVSKMIHPLLEHDDYRRRFNGNINETKVDERVEREFNPNIDFFTAYGPLLLKSPVFPGMKEVVANLAQRFGLIIISSTTTGLITSYLDQNGMDAWFKEIMGNDMHTSKVAKMRMALEKYAAAPEECFFVTDTLGDIMEAAHVGIPAIAVTWGYQPRSFFEAANPSAIVETPAELFDILTRGGEADASRDA